MKHELIVTQCDVGERLDIFVTLKLKLIYLNKKNISRTKIKDLIEKNLVKINNKECKANYIVKKNDIVVIDFVFEEKNINFEPENISFEIIYEDNEIIVVNKKQGMVVHPGAGNFSGTLANGLLFYIKKNNSNLSNLNGDFRPGIVHRIDKDTSGIIVVAKNNSSHIFLADQFEKHTINRKYLAIVCGNLNSNGKIDKPISRDKFNRKKMCIQQNGKRAVTHYRVLKNFAKYSLIKLKLETGRTHQIRVHMASIGHPILGDKIYGHDNNKFNLSGQALHAGVLGFVHPATKKYIEFKKKPPEYFLNLIKKLRS